ncbi:MAG: hypothetical protein WC375_12725 [Methanomassiliicoccales archaeon]|jgi:hypothetical protein
MNVDYNVDDEKGIFEIFLKDDEDQEIMLRFPCFEYLREAQQFVKMHSGTVGTWYEIEDTTYISTEHVEHNVGAFTLGYLVFPEGSAGTFAVYTREDDNEED